MLHPYQLQPITILTKPKQSADATPAPYHHSSVQEQQQPHQQQPCQYSIDQLPTTTVSSHPSSHSSGQYPGQYFGQHSQPWCGDRLPEPLLMPRVSWTQRHHGGDVTQQRFSQQYHYHNAPQASAQIPPFQNHQPPHISFSDPRPPTSFSNSQYRVSPNQTREPNEPMSIPWEHQPAPHNTQQSQTQFPDGGKTIQTSIPVLDPTLFVDDKPPISYPYHSKPLPPAPTELPKVQPRGSPPVSLNNYKPSIPRRYRRCGGGSKEKSADKEARVEAAEEEDSTEDRYERRRRLNRQSAQRFRERSKALVENLEMQVLKLNMMRMEMEAKVARLEGENLDWLKEREDLLARAQGGVEGACSNESVSRPTDLK